MIDPESVLFRGAVKLVDELYEVDSIEELTNWLKQHPDLSIVLLEAHHLCRPIFDFGLPIRIDTNSFSDSIDLSFGVVRGEKNRKNELTPDDRLVVAEALLCNRATYDYMYLINLQFYYAPDPCLV